MNIPDLATLAASEVPNPGSTISPAWLVRHKLIELLQGTQKARHLLSLRYEHRFTLAEMAQQADTSEAAVLACWVLLYEELSSRCGFQVEVPNLSTRFNPWKGFLQAESEFGAAIRDCQKLLAEMIVNNARVQKRMEECGLW